MSVYREIINKTAATPCANAVAEHERLEMPRHVIALSDKQWALWRWVGLRGAGFPTAMVLKLASPDSAAAADSILQAEQDARQARHQALDILKHDLKDADTETRPLLRRALEKLKKDKSPEPLNVGNATASIET